MQTDDAQYSFQTIGGVSQGLFRDRNSKFIACAFPVETEADIQQQLLQLKKEYHDARHFCHAYILGKDKTKWKANDDGEPSGSAGLPIYNQIQSSGLTNILVVVVRYFGGTKLGVPGLINAYKTATRLALEEAEIITVVPTRRLEIQFGYEMMNTVMSFCKNNNLLIESKEFAEVNTIIVIIPATIERKVDEFSTNISLKFRWLS